MITGLAMFVVFLLMLGLMALGITRGLGKKQSQQEKPFVPPEAELGLYVEAILWPVVDVPAQLEYEGTTTVGQIIAIAVDGTMTVRDWEHGDEHRCLSTGFTIVMHDEASIMHELRTAQDSIDMGEPTSKSVH
jgi:hypothetical protein